MPSASRAAEPSSPGTLPAGRIGRGDELLVTPALRPVRIRGLQSLGEDAATLTGVARAALNLRGVDRSDVARGMALIQPGRWTLARQIDVRIAGGGGRDSGHDSGTQDAERCRRRSPCTSARREPRPGSGCWAAGWPGCSCAARCRCTWATGCCCVIRAPLASGVRRPERIPQITLIATTTGSWSRALAWPGRRGRAGHQSAAAGSPRRGRGGRRGTRVLARPAGRRPTCSGGASWPWRPDLTPGAGRASTSPRRSRPAGWPIPSTGPRWPAAGRAGRRARRAGPAVGRPAGRRGPRVAAAARPPARPRAGRRPRRRSSWPAGSSRSGPATRRPGLPPALAAAVASLLDRLAGPSV